MDEFSLGRITSCTRLSSDWSKGIFELAVSERGMVGG